MADRAPVARRRALALGMVVSVWGGSGPVRGSDARVDSVSAVPLRRERRPDGLARDAPRRHRHRRARPEHDAAQ